jgi:hypothetical protein
VYASSISYVNLVFGWTVLSWILALHAVSRLANPTEPIDIPLGGKAWRSSLTVSAGFHCTPENVEQVQNTLRSFYDLSKAVEVRHKSWSENTYTFEENTGTRSTEIEKLLAM